MFVNTPLQSPDSQPFDYNLRPKTWQGYIGQDKIKQTLEVMIKATQEREEPLDHILLYGSPGLGKTTLANLIAKEMGVHIFSTSGPAIRKSGDLASILSNLNKGDILFIDEVHRLNNITEEMIYPAMEDFKMNIVVGKGPMAQTMEINLPPFTLIGATTKVALLSSPFRSRFGATFQLSNYNKEEIKTILKNSANNLKIEIDNQACETIAACSRSTPRIANQILKRVRDFSQVDGQKIITKEAAKNALDFLEIDDLGLGIEDRKILQIIIDKYRGGPVGIKSLSASSEEEEDTILDVYEPYLMQLGFLERTLRGRTATKAAYEYLKINYQDNESQNKLL
ncbi:MAG TPA: Holliday junction branch migration DNA helicase RuvB [Candidatus Pacearchaeota archaeon]|jgi:Holliday junction DNA helicase RuvB|nr:Holliday junction branch migration DNA helicase RuvB [Candidatus Parcubacteria bacterium]HNZ83695.1 Holliday junction branch migration DNA helicase RuvB [Candidatus Pacearchaeota archaeon]HOU45627.1 Holliday junction branch migration DNA helicase RuvB [Candidatus Pacearchaeota archaeon]HPM08311.1 Holliday junction branch migration DNA helicase RuvB [Candidatus Pacearchaeota archaeon]HQI74556.1 Holliday junction branch migration DNA helicase RuvB [Candidatus Pacearchaeota archaeon]